MVFRPRLIVRLSIFFLIVFAVIPYAFLQWGIAARDFRQFAEAKAGEFLKAKVEIGKIRVRFPNRVVLSDLKVSRETSSSAASRLEIGQMMFRYNLLQLFSRNLKAPAGVTLRGPKMALSESGFPYAFFQNFQAQDHGAGREMMKVEFAGGEIRYPIPGIASEILLTNIRGKMVPAGNGKIKVDLRSNLQGTANGKVWVKGEVDTLHKQHTLALQLDSLTGAWGGPLDGKIRWEGDTLWLDRLRAKVYGWDSEMRGSIKDFSTGPEVRLSFDMGRKAHHAGFSFQSNFKTGGLQAALRLPGAGNYQLEGKIVREGARILFPELKLETGHHGNGHADFSSGDVHFLFEKENQRIGADFNLKKPGIRLSARLDHVRAAGLDLVTSGTIDLMPLTQNSLGSRPAKFQGEFKTEYFILEYTPFNDLKGGFEVSPAGIRDFSASWGKVFDLSGEVRFVRPLQTALSLRVNRFDLNGVKKFAAKPLPRELGGVLEGRLRIDGELNHPEISGKFIVKDGRIGKLEYDMGILQFHGFPPYLPLDDSRILKGRTTLFLNGALDFRMRNMFSGIQLQTDDKLVIWKGWEMNTSESQGDVEIESSISKLPIFNIKAGQGVSSPGIPKDSQDANDRYVAAGPKFKF